MSLFIDNTIQYYVDFDVPINYFQVIMPKRIPSTIIVTIRELRKQGLSLPEIQKQVGIGYGTVYRYIQGVQIDEKYRQVWLGKRGGSIKRKKIAEQNALGMARNIVGIATDKEQIIFLSALYWGEGNKTDFSIINSDPNLIKIVVSGLQRVFDMPISRIRPSVRIYQGIDQEQAVRFWSKSLGIPRENFGQSEIIQGAKIGKLPYGMCRVRVLRGGDLLKYVKAIYMTMAESLLSP